MNATSVTTRAQHLLVFGSHEIKTIQRDGQFWMSSSQLREALEYVDEKAVHRIYSAHADEFTGMMTHVFKVATAGGKQAIRFFSLRGAHLVAMFARTPVAKAFRAWVLDILDREVAELQAKATKGVRLDEETKREIERLAFHAEHLRSWWDWIAPAIRLFNRALAGNVHDHFMAAAQCSRIVVRELRLESVSDYASEFPWEAGYTQRAEYAASARGR